MNNFTFLTDEQIFGDNQLDIIRKYGRICEITDFSILLGGNVSSTYNMFTGWWGTKTLYNTDYVCFVDTDGNRAYSDVSSRNIGARPAVPYFLIKSSSSNAGIDSHGIKIIKYGEYPQSVVDEDYSQELEKAYNNKYLRMTGKLYTTDGVNYQYDDVFFRGRTYIEYEYYGRNYIRFVGTVNGEGEFLSDDRIVKRGEVYWLLVEPIIWLVDEKADIALSEKIIFSGVQFNNTKNSNKNFDRCDIKKFMDKYFSKEIVSNRIYPQEVLPNQIQEEVKGKVSIRKKNPYDFNFEDVSEEDIIGGTVESNVSVFLHGKSSDGKSARVKQLDPDCEIIYMRNATPDSLNGKSVYNAETGEMFDVPPTWYSRVLAKCEAEPDKIHIIFFDELTNALPSIQGMAFNIVLDGEVNGKWKLPPNARIVAAGNDLTDSLAANQMAEPLFNRFAHVYINTTVDSWLKWASTPKETYARLDYKEEVPTTKIHPAIYSFIAYKAASGKDVLRTQYTGERPNADPRKWEMASKVLYKTGNPNMLRCLVGEDITREFVQFCKIQVITLEDVINDNYCQEDINRLNTAERYVIATALSQVDENNLEKVRSFSMRLGKEFGAIFDSLWTHGDEGRLERIAEEKLKDGGIKKYER